MTVLAIEHTSFTDTHVTVTAVVDDMRLLYRATRFEPEMASAAILISSILTGNLLTTLTTI